MYFCACVKITQLKHVVTSHAHSHSLKEYKKLTSIGALLVQMGKGKGVLHQFRCRRAAEYREVSAKLGVDQQPTVW